jgi:hypothetical protein
LSLPAKFFHLNGMPLAHLSTMGTLRTASLSVLVAALLVAALATVVPHAISATAQSASSQATKPAAAMPAAASIGSPATQPAPKPRDRAKEQAELRHANVVLATLQRTYRGLDGVTLRIDPTPNDAQAVAYYTQSEIVISPDHVASIDKILAHEVWHVIDWRDNGRLDWGEDLPPSNASAYRSRY